jgi:uncharacterized protein
MIVVSDTTAISCLFKLEKLDLLTMFSQEIYMPDAVWLELSRLKEKGYDLSPLLNAEWLKVESVKDVALVSQLKNELDAGESEAIVVALEKNAQFLLIDEMDGRAKAGQLGVPTIELIGVLLTLKQNQLIPAIKPLLDELRNNAGFYLSDAFYLKILSSIGE